MIFILSGCAIKDNREILISDVLDAELYIKQIDNEFDLTMHRSIPKIYSFQYNHVGMGNILIDINSETFEINCEGLSVNEVTLPKSSCLFTIVSTLDYLSENNKQLKYGEIRDSIIVLYGNNGYVDFTLYFDLNENLPQTLKVESEGLEVIFSY